MSCVRIGCSSAVISVIALSACQPRLAAQSQGPLESHVEHGVVASRSMDPAGALRHFQAALALDSTNYEANWRAAIAAIDIGKQTPDEVESPRRDSLYALAERYARRAIDAELLEPDGHYALAAAIGRASLTKGNRERVRRAREVWVEAKKALELDPNHNEALHTLGRWHAEIKRLSGLQRWAARNLYGADFMKKASWDSAAALLERAVAAAPEVIYHRLDLGEIYLDLGRNSEARAQFRAVDSLPPFDVLDQRHKGRADSLLARLDSD